MTGYRSGAAIAEFWAHCEALEAWKDHPCLTNSGIPRDRLLPLLIHCDGAEFYNNTEFVVWSVGSALSEGHVWDIKFPIACVPHEAMVDPNVKNAVNQLIAQVVGWSLRQAARGEAPATGCFGETLEGDRAQMAGSELALGWRACYFGSKYDAKARKEIN
ncbi:unnamed protein product, partial [Durusdinium trenchii]